ncbi:hypothetical protein ACFL1R_13045 [Candidatus Latescibacterota bacterium]
MEGTWKLRRISILSAMKIGGVVSGVLGFLFGIILGIVMAFFSSMITMVLDKPAPGMSVLVLLIMPFLSAVFYGILGVFYSFFITLLYNLAAGLLGGFEFEMRYDHKIEHKDDTQDIYGVK